MNPNHLDHNGVVVVFFVYYCADFLELMRSTKLSYLDFGAEGRLRSCDHMLKRQCYIIAVRNHNVFLYYGYWIMVIGLLLLLDYYCCWI